MAVPVEFTDPFTGEKVVIYNPWTYDPERTAWIADDLNYVTGTHFNNLLKFGQPWDPNNYYGRKFYKAELEGIIPDLGPTVILSQEDVYLNGFGRNIKFDDFELVKNLKKGYYSDKLLTGRSYTLSELQVLGISPVKIGGNGQDYGDHALSTTLYGNIWGGQDPFIQPGARYPIEAAYIWGSVRFQISQDTVFRFDGNRLSVEGKIQILSDDFNHEGSLPPIVSAFVQALFGDTANYEKVIILYEGEGVRRSYRAILSGDECFLAGTLVTLDNGTTKPIEAIRPEDRVMTYDSRGALVPARVTRTFVNDVTNVLDFHGTGVTPGHVFLCGAGRFQGRHVPLLDILRDDGAVVRQDGRKSRNRLTKERACRPFRRQRLIAAYANVLGSKATGLRLPAPVARCSKDFAR
ncbi:MAG: hypothetical protein INH06_21305 [Cupriavidus sp.]|nr:hypothetical protein [Cupriavidus sp.]